MGELDGSALIGRALGEFVIRKPLSGGGFGLVFLADQKALHREAVVKVLREGHREDEEIVQRFLREARLASLLDHPYAAHTYGFGAETDGVLWIAMEHVRGTPLDALLRLQGPIPLERFVPLLLRICEVVATAHEQGIVHRDLKPANVMVLSRAGQLLPKLLDFGIAKLTGEAEAPTLPATDPPTDTGEADLPLTMGRVAMGSPHYMAPEQWSDAAAADARADIYSLGVICYQSLTGRLPFRAPSRDGLASMHAIAPVPPLGDGLPAALDLVLAQAMAKRPAQRHASALDLAAAFEEASGTRSAAALLPRLDPALCSAALTRAPQPLARAIAALEAARNPHEARDALWQVARVAVRLVACVALAACRHVATQAHQTDPEIGEQMRRLRQRAPADDVWLAVARALVRPFADLRDAHPVPELVGYLLGDGAARLSELVALRAEAEGRSGGGERQVRELLERVLPIAARAVEALDFLFDYPLVVARDHSTTGAGGDETVDFRPRGRRARADGELWMGIPGPARPRLAIAGAALSPGHAALVDAAGVAVVTLWPFIQLHEPSPGAEPVLFFFDGRGRRGARLVAAPDPFELEDDAGWEAFGELLHDSADGERSASAEEIFPYPGLSAFTEADAAGFFGRERETEAFVNRLRVQPLLVVAGPSGAGKSSFAQAGVLPALPAGWQPILVRPGPAPIAGLATRLAAAGIACGDLRADPNALGAALRGRAPVTTVLVIDQLEELFTMCDDDPERAEYAALVARAARSADDPVRVVMTVRDDFLARAESLPAWRSRLGQGLQILNTPAEPELRRILVEPLRRAGYEMDDPALADEMIASVAGAPGALALLSFTASRLWQLRDRRFRHLTRKAYRSLGGVGGALAQHAEATLAAMPSDEQRLVRDVFRHAITAEGTRAILTPGELEGALGGGAPAAAVVAKLVAARLLVVADTELGERIEVAHETLVEGWPRLVEWRREDAEGARLRDLVRTAARQWQERGRASGLLWRGDALTEYRIWRGRHPAALTPTEEAFAAASLADAARGRRRLRLLIGGAFVALAAVAVALLILRARADKQRAIAVESRHAAERSAGELNKLLREQYEAQGRRLLLADDPLQALVYLARAGEAGVHGVAHELLVAQAVRASDGELVSVQHDHMVTRVRLSGDGTRLLTSSYDHQARLWDAHSGRLLTTLEHPDGVVRAALSPAGDLIATGTVDGRIKLWTVAGAPLRELRATGEVQAIEFSPDGTRLLTSTSGDEVVIWDPRSGAAVARLREATGAPDGPRGAPAILGPRGTLVAAGDRAGVVRVWDTRSWRLVAQLNGHGDRVVTVRFSPDGDRLVSASLDNTAIIWRLAPAGRQSILRHRDDVLSASFSPDGNRVVTASVDQTAVVWDATDGTARFALDGHLASVNLAAFSPDGRLIATVSDDATARLWDAASGRPLARRLGHAAPIRDMVFGADGRLATASLDRTASVWSTEPSERVTPLAGHSGEVMKVDVAPDGEHLVTGGVDGTARVWDRRTGRELVIIRAHDHLVDVRYSPEGDRLATAGADHLVKVWDARTGRALFTLTGHTAQVNGLSWHPGGDRLASAGDRTVRIWSTRTGELLRILPEPGGRIVFGTAYAPSGELLLSTAEDNTVRLWDAERGRALEHFPDRGRYAPSFDRTGDRVITLTPTSARIWSPRSGQAPEIDLVGHIGGVQDAGWSTDGRLVVTAGMDGTARIWDPDSGSLLAVFSRLGRASSVRLAPDARWLVAGGSDGTAAVWELPRWTGSSADLARLVRCRAPYRIEGERMISQSRERSMCGPTSTHR